MFFLLYSILPVVFFFIFVLSCTFFSWHFAEIFNSFLLFSNHFLEYDQDLEEQKDINRQLEQMVMSEEFEKELEEVS